MRGTASPGRRDGLAGWLLSTPALLLLLAFLVTPFLCALGWSFTDHRLGSPLPTRFVGLEQYLRALGDDGFQRGLLNSALFALAVVPIQTGLALGLAVALNARLRGIAIYRAAFFMPVVYPMALVAVVWLLLYAPGPRGLVNAWLGALSFGAWDPGNHQGLLTNPWTALPAIIALSIWQGLGFQTVILLAGLQDIPRNLHEAAAIDGAGAWQRFRHVTVPGLRGPLVFTALVTTILAFRLFDQVRIMTRGGPDDATTTILYETVRAAFDRHQVGLGSAMSVILFVIVCTLGLVQLWWTRRRARA